MISAGGFRLWALALLISLVCASDSRLSLSLGKLPASDNMESVPLYNAKILYFVNISFGTPPQTLPVLLDSGSSTLVINGKNCFECSDHTYNPSASTTATLLSCGDSTCGGGCDVSGGCGFCVGYGDGSSMSGPLYTDKVVLTGDSTLSATVSVAVANIKTSRSLPASISGILGVAYQSLDCLSSSCSVYYEGPRTCVTPALDTLTRSAGVPNVLSMCMSPQGGLGTFTVGDPDPSYYKGPIIYTDILTPNGQLSAYFVSFAGLSANGTQDVSSSDLPQYALVDSGTTMWILPSYTIMALGRAVAPFSTKLGNILQTSILQGQCQSWTVAEYAALPNIELTLGSAVLSVPPSVYLLPCDNGLRRVGIVNGGSSFQFSIVGDAVLNGYYTIYNRISNQVGFASQNCGGNRGVVVAAPVFQMPIYGWILIAVGGALIIGLIVGCCVYRCLKARMTSSETSGLLR